MESPELLRHLICSICHEYLERKHYGCANSHRFCTNCITESKIDLLNECCVCKQGKVNLMNDQLITELCYFFNIDKKCKCNKIIKMKDYDEHVKTCMDDRIKCVKYQCKHMFDSKENLTNILNHYINYHRFSIKTAADVIDCTKNSRFIIPLTHDTFIFIKNTIWYEQNNYYKGIIKTINTAINVINVINIYNLPLEEKFIINYNEQDYILNNENNYIKEFTNIIDNKNLNLIIKHNTLDEITKIIPMLQHENTPAFEITDWVFDSDDDSDNVDVNYLDDDPDNPDDYSDDY